MTTKATNYNPKITFCWDTPLALAETCKKNREKTRTLNQIMNAKTKLYEHPPNTLKEKMSNTHEASRRKTLKTKRLAIEDICRTGCGQGPKTKRKTLIDYKLNRAERGLNRGRKRMGRFKFQEEIKM